MQTINFRTAAVVISRGIITATFADGAINEFNTHWLDRPEYREIAQDKGYGEDFKLYALEHELTHHFVADNLGWRWSWAVHDNIHYPVDAMPEHIAWEEHIVNHLQKLMRTGENDPYNVVQLLGLDRKVQQLREVCDKIDLDNLYSM